MIQSLAERFLRSSIVGVDIESSEIRLAELTRRNGKYELTLAVTAMVQDKNPTRSLHDVLIRNGLRSRDLAIGVASPDLVVHPYRFPKMPKKELEAAIRLEAEHLIAGYSASDVRLDWVDGLLAASPKDLLGREIEKVTAAGGNPVIVDVKTLALWNAYSILNRGSDSAGKPTLLIHIGEDITHLVIASGAHELILARDIEIGRRGLEEGNLGEWISETRDSLEYARSKNGLRAIHAARLTGMEDSTILQRLKPLLGVALQPWNVLDHVSSKVPMERSEGLGLAIAVGLALRTFE